MRLSDTIATAIADRREPAAALALVYAERIDEATHVPRTLADALDKLRYAAQLADERTAADKLDDAHMRAFRRVAAALSAVTVAGDLGPKLLAALDSLLLTPKARAAVGQAVANAAPASDDPKRRLRDRYVTRHLRAAS